MRGGGDDPDNIINFTHLKLLYLFLTLANY